MNRKLLLKALGALLLSGCAQNGFAAFVVNQDAHAQAKPGKSYSAEPCHLNQKPGQLVLVSGQAGQPSSLELTVALPAGKNPSAILGQTLDGVTGQAQVEDRKLELEKGTFTLQTLQGQVARGNFNARAKGQNPPWEVVGSFEAHLR